MESQPVNMILKAFLVSRTVLVIQSVVLTLVITGEAGATTQYQPVMSKDDKLCDTVLSTLNHDLTEYEEIRYGSHQSTPVIKWRRMSELHRRFDDGVGFDDVARFEEAACESFRWAKFDMNNDHKTDFVVKKSMCWVDGEWKGIEDSLWSFKGTYTGYKSAKTSKHVLGAYSDAGIGFLTFSGYYLSDIPRSYEDLRVEESITSPMAVIPFRFQGATYLHIDSEIPNVRNIIVHIVAKYKREALAPMNVKKTPDVLLPNLRYKGLEDICYYMAEVSERKPVERLEDGYVLRP